MKKIVLSFFLVSFFCSISSQPFGNEWIKTNQKYYKIKIGKPGVYRVYCTELLPLSPNLGLDLPAVNPKKIQMFFQGKEIPIYVSGESDNIFNTYDYIEFYAQLNNGLLDKDLYGSPDFHANDRVSMITDTSAYYITFLPNSSSQNGWHMQNYNNTNFSSYTPEPFFMHEASQSFFNMYNQGKGFDVGGHDASNPEYTKAEGYCSNYFGSGTGYASFNAQLETRFQNTSGPKPSVIYTTAGSYDSKASALDHHVKVYISTDNNTFNLVGEHQYDGFDIINNKQDVDYSWVGGNNTYWRFDAQFVSSVPYATHAINYIGIRYARNYDLDNQTIMQHNIAGTGGPTYIDWSNYNANKSAPLAYDLTNGYRIRGQKYSGNKVRYILPPSSTPTTQCYINDSMDIVNILARDIEPAMSDHPASFEELLKFDPASILNANRLVLVTNEKFVGDYTAQYLNLRSTSTYASPCALITVQQLYNHFSYGTPHPIAIRRYLRYMKANGDTTLKFMFLVGRGYQVDMLRNNANMVNLNLVPAIGVPASDNMFGTEITDSTLAPTVAIGRLTIDRDVDFGLYINKLIDYEANANEFWRKSVLHLAGGENGNQAAYIKSRLDYAGSWITGEPFGGRTTTYTKSSVGLSDPYLKEKAIDNVNQGMQMVTFLGHGSAAVTDIDIGDTIEYNNNGKYPIFYFNGCSIGNPCMGPPDKNIKLSGENFIKAHNRGAIAFIAQTALSELGAVDDQIQSFYRSIFHDKYNGAYTVGEAIKDMLKLNANYSSELVRIQSRILFLQGDPSLAFFQPQRPDYQITEKTIFLAPYQQVTAVSDSFAVAVPIENKGKYVTDSISINIERSYPNNFLVTKHKFRIPGMGYVDTAYLYIKSKDVATAGINTFTIVVNQEHDPKLNEDFFANNTAIYSQDIAGNGISLVYPKRFDIVSHLVNDSVELVAQALNLFEKNFQFQFEIDTSYRFDSPWKKSDQSSSIVGQTKKWRIKLLGTRDSIVYYWRARIIIGTQTGGVWSERSFVHIFDNEPGWSQSDFPQFYPSSKTSNIVLDTIARQLTFSSTAEKVFVDTWLDKKANFGIKKGGHGALSLNPGAGNGIVAVLFDRNSLQQIKLPGIFNPDRYYGVDYYEDALKAYSFWLIGADGDKFVRWVDSIPDSTYVAISIVNGFRKPEWDPSIDTAFSKLGANLVHYIQSYYTSYAMIGKKGAPPGWAVEDTGSYFSSSNDQSYIEIEKEMIGRKGNGVLSTEMIGPTTKWGKLYHYNHSLDMGRLGDDFYINVHGVTNGGIDSVIYENVRNDDLDLSGIDAQRFPHIYLEGVFEDFENYTPSQIKAWRVTDEEVPEGSLNPNITNLIWRDSLKQGEDFNFEIGFQNISRITFGKNLKYQVMIFNVDNKDTVYNVTQYYPDTLPTDKYFMIKATQVTKAMKGRYAYVVKVNFDSYNKSMLPELSLVNNSAIRYFYVEEDLINPLLDVTFDGRHISNGEIVSANPTIYVTSKDENMLNWQTDTNGIKIWWKTPQSPNFERIDFDSFGVKFYPATSTYNQAKAEFSPKNLKDGLYTLKVQSNDANHTNAGTTEYMVNFMVINQASATNFYPYPNPFTSAMRFVFTLTGSQVPDYISIKIMTVTGKVVKELSKDDLGEIRIGNNITDVVWDGTDQYGDRLANGVYLYTVTIRVNGEEVTQLESDTSSSLLNADKANNNMFKHSTGKIVLMR